MSTSGSHTTWAAAYATRVRGGSAEVGNGDGSPSVYGSSDPSPRGSWRGVVAIMPPSRPRWRSRPAALRAALEADGDAREILDFDRKRRAVRLAALRPGNAAGGRHGFDGSDQVAQQVEEVRHHILDDAATGLFLLIKPRGAIEHGLRAQ